MEFANFFSLLLSSWLLLCGFFFSVEESDFLEVVSLFSLELLKRVSLDLNKGFSFKVLGFSFMFYGFNSSAKQRYISLSNVSSVSSAGSVQF